MITISDLTLSFDSDRGRTIVLKDFHLDIADGEFIAIVGASGVGKSTLLRVVAGLVRPTSGTVKRDSPERPGRRPYAMVFQDARLLPWRRVVKNVEFGLEGLGLTAEEKRRRATEALALVGLADKADRWPHQLSGGQRQRVAIARALAVDPDLLMMDEPFGALDAITRQSLQDELIDLWQRTGKTILFVTHDIEEAVYLADRVVLLAGSPAGVRSADRIMSARPRQRDDEAARHTAAEIRTRLYDYVEQGEGI
ncbi:MULTISPECIES: ABC transporter ATP-binding protein [Azospirillaceae]|nr:MULTISPECIES: ABC transporter ATP-binding protein [Azospirillaceae]MDG5495325.1 ABC transporter ATP-binding protein [Niveispirillum sp. BGYR6]SNS89465.1 NitT/TauT family transport system ATP-binding protein [Azospirillum sp. RU38E]SNT06661.1 NitT/TauT family transport system ATP-binding protein [Azospirillum sp. RU37A]